MEININRKQFDEKFDKAWKLYQKKVKERGRIPKINLHKAVLPVAAGIGIGFALHKNTSEKKASYLSKTARTALTKHILKSLNPNVFGAKDVARVAKGMGGGSGREAIVENVLKKHHLGKEIGRDIAKRKAKTVAHSVKGSPKSVGSSANVVRATEKADIKKIRATAKVTAEPINYETKALLGLQDVAKATKSTPVSAPKVTPKRKFDWSGRVAKGKEKARRAGKKVKRVGYGVAAAGATIGVGSAVYAGQPTENINRQPRYYG